MTVQIKASFGKDKRHLDGLDHHRKNLIDEPLRPRVAILVFNVSDINHNVLEGTDTPRIQVQQIEVMDGADAIKTIDMMNSAFQRRTGREDSQASLFDDWAGPAAPTELDEQAAEAVERLEARRAETARFIGEHGPELALNEDPADGPELDGEGVRWDPDGLEDSVAGAEIPEIETSPAWPGDVEFQAPDGEGEDPPADEPPAPAGRRSRKR